MMKRIFGNVTLLALGILFGFTATVLMRPPQSAARVVHFDGTFGALRFCEDDDGKLISQNGFLSVECTDLSKMPMTVTPGPTDHARIRGLLGSVAE